MKHILIPLLRLGAAAFILAIALAAPSHARVLENPDDRSIQLLAAYLANETPNFREQALKDYDYRSANEFDKPQVLKRIEERLRSEYEGFGEIDGILIRTRSNLGQYDAASEVFRISAFKPGVYFRFGRNGLLLDNAPDLYEWALPVADARRVRELSPSGNVLVEMLIVPFAVAPDNKNNIRGQIVDMKISEQGSGQLLHEVVIPENERKSISSGGGERPDHMDESAVTLANFRLGMSRQEAIAALEEAGYNHIELVSFKVVFSSAEPDVMKTAIGSSFNMTQ